ELLPGGSAVGLVAWRLPTWRCGCVARLSQARAQGEPRRCPRPAPIAGGAPLAGGAGRGRGQRRRSPAPGGLLPRTVGWPTPGSTPTILPIFGAACPFLVQTAFVVQSPLHPMFA